MTLTMNPAGRLSDRAENVSNGFDDSILDILLDLYDPENNPNGWVNVGVAENSLMHPELKKYVNENMNGVSERAFTYGEGAFGSARLRDATARMLNRYLKPVIPLKAEHLAATNGCSHAIEHCSWAFTDPGDGILLGRPYYGTFLQDLQLRPGARVIPVAFGSDIDPMSLEGVAKYEEAFLKARDEGITVKAMVLCSPHNPLSRCYSRATLVRIMKFCQKYQLHLISDEIYALSVWENREDSTEVTIPFTSVLSIPLDGIIDPGLVHVLWAVSKDFGANGLRLGYIISQHNKDFLRVVMILSLYSFLSSLTDYLFTKLFSDEDWVDNYIMTNRERMSESYSFAVRWLKKHDIEYALGGNAAFFIWMNLGETYHKLHPELFSKNPPQDRSVSSTQQLPDISKTISAALGKEKVFIQPGEIMGSESAGWFRLVFTHPPALLEVGFERLLAALSK